ncbi:MAG: DNA primase [Candidatus Zambryskibacteria bacterium RIFCSPHIGHO2_12_FULL_43_12b]|uniref:DNA primase n=1 Tax=Candidatus Zambryskibacteria bacterium RIFCSPLOWO2_01_FULL_43_17 TaxID=1802760 RepID=A0A1G2U5M0_9BACT|nr:MAG: DNA primase [Candidatus Zambryskibacteria bacterium RIFCSPHIGHO2_12_FULL_43_12b]OHB04795.1 MAG: DNA primase [Candidatus Zambryskibacteria bacterium RIFCSPLOWO2_01_FULL_43_17]
MKSSSVDKIKERLDIVSVVGSYLKLEKAGSNFKARCPFHNEKTPSFFVSPSRNSYYCFGCGAKGDIFTFAQEFEGLDFIGALKMLAERAGVELERFDPKNRGERDELYSILETARSYFTENLNENKKAIEYLTDRGLKEETVKTWRLGYAQNEWRNLYSHFISLGMSAKKMIEAGLIKRSDTLREDGYYDVFRGRIIFPIFDVSGRPVAFSGRIFDEAPDAPKYLNSPETPLFVKSETLYGLDKAKIGIRKKDYSMLVEGQMDLLMCHQAGFDNAVASSGTAFTEAHLERLKRLSNRIIFVFDSDSAGFQASLKSATLALSLGMEVKLAELPKGEDPAELIKKDLDAFRNSIKNSKHLIDFHLDRLLASGFEDRNLIKEIEKKILPYVTKLQSSIEQSHFVSQIAKKAGIKEEAIWDDLRRTARTEISAKENKEFTHYEGKSKNHLERRLYGILFWQEGEKNRLFDTEKLRLNILTILGEKEMVEALRGYEEQKNELIFEAEQYYENKDGVEKELEELLMNFKEDSLRKRFVIVMKELQEAEDKKDDKKAKELLKRCQEITEQLAELSKKRALN